jgi:hypothetical protein
MLNTTQALIRRTGWALWLALAIFALVGLRSCWANENTREVSVVGYNYTPRPIYTFSVNGGAGSNIFINGGGAGSASCCTPVTIGQAVEVRWMYSYTKKQFEAGLREERFSTQVTVPPPPPEHPEARYLEVHFYPDGRVELALVNFPGDRRLPDLPEED